MSTKVVFDTSTVVSALVFRSGRLGWLKKHWREGRCVPLISIATSAELARVLGYQKFQLTSEDRRELLGDYLPWCEIAEANSPCPQVCRDPQDQPFLDLAFSGDARILVASDLDLLALAGQTRFFIDTPEAYRLRVGEE